MSLSKTAKNLIAASVCALLSLGGYVYLVHLIQAEVSVSEELARDVARESARGVELARMESERRLVDESRAQLDGYFLKEEDIVDLLGTFEELGQRAGAGIEVRSVNDTQVAAPNNSGGTQETMHAAVRLVLELSGTWASVYHTLALLETYPLPIVLESVSLQRIGRQPLDEGEQPTWESVVTLSVARVVQEE